MAQRPSSSTKPSPFTQLEYPLSGTAYLRFFKHKGISAFSRWILVHRSYSGKKSFLNLDLQEIFDLALCEKKNSYYAPIMPRIYAFKRDVVKTVRSFSYNFFTGGIPHLPDKYAPLSFFHKLQDLDQLTIWNRLWHHG